MSFKYILTVILTLINVSIFSQINLIPNPGFEIGKPGKSPQCVYFGSDLINNDILYWKRAKCNVGGNILPPCTNRFSFPDWMEPGLCGSTPFTHSRYIYLEERATQGFQDAIRVGLLSTMNTLKNYIFKINYTYAGPRKSTSPPSPSESYPRVTIHLTKYSEHWSSSWGNVSLKFSMYPPTQQNAPNPSGWAQHWHILNGPLINSHPFFGNIFNDLKNIVLDCSGRHVYIDYVELSENCPNPLLIENHQFYNNVNEIPYKAGSILKAGYDVGNPSPNGNVVVNNGAKATFKAGSQIILEPGFIVEEGADFETIFEPCNSNTAKVDNEIIVIDEKTIQIGDITIYDDRVETLACSDTLRIFGLDGDTTSFVNYFWDFGNGQTSNSPVGEVFYENSGEYTVKLALTDSSGVTDTLSKIYIQPDCKGKTNRLSNDTTNNKSNTVSYLSPTIFPNPTAANINITQLNNFVGGNIEIINLMGQVIFTTTINSNQLSADLSKHPKGIYLIKISSDKEQVIEKIVLE